MAKHPDFEIRCALASNPDLNPRAQEVLTRDGEIDVLTRLATNPALTPQAQMALGDVGSTAVCYHLGMNPSLVLHDELPVAFLERIPPGKALLDGRLMGSDPAALAALRPGFEGSLSELLEVLAAFAPER